MGKYDAEKVDKKCLHRRQLPLKIGWPGASHCKDDI